MDANTSLEVGRWLIFPFAGPFCEKIPQNRCGHGTVCYNQGRYACEGSEQQRQLQFTPIWAFFIGV
jgi:hypothetical protein